MTAAQSSRTSSQPVELAESTQPAVVRIAEQVLWMRKHQHLTQEQLAKKAALIGKGQQLAGHFPSEGALVRARRILVGELSADDARAEVDERIRAIAAAERAEHSTEVAEDDARVRG